MNEAADWPRFDQSQISFATIQEQTMNSMITSKPLRGLLATAILGAVTAGSTAASKAGDLADVPSVTVHYGDLNLSTPQGAATLYSRIAAAAHQVCDSGRDDLALRQATRACIDKAVADAVVKVGHPELIAVYNAKTHRALPTTVAAAR
jgi:UrcA family protein